MFTLEKEIFLTVQQFLAETVKEENKKPGRKNYWKNSLVRLYFVEFYDL